MKGLRVLALVVLVAAVGAVLSVPRRAAAAPGPPNIMPGFPMIAGPVVMIMWTPVPGAASYNIYMNGKQVAKALPGPPYQGPKPEDPGVYLYEVTAVGADGSESPRSAQGKISVIKLLPPKNVVSLVQQGPQNAIALRWEPQTGTQIVDVYRAEKSEGPYTMLISLQESRYVDSTVKKGGSYFYKLKAKDITGKESDFSETLTVKLEEQAAAAAAKKLDLKLKKARVTRLDPSEKFVDADFVMREDKIFLADRDAGVIHIYDLEGKKTGSLGAKGYLPGQLVYPGGLDILPNGNIVVSDYARKVVIVLDPAGALVREWKLPTPKGMPEAKPWRVAASGDGEIYVADYESLLIYKFSEDGRVLDTFAGKIDKKDRKPEQLAGVSGIVPVAGGRVVVSDFRGAQLKVYGPDGKVVFSVGTPAGVGSFVQPGKAIVDEKKKEILVPDQLMATVQAFSLDSGEYLYTLTSEEGKADKSNTRGEWAVGNPVALAWAPGGQIYAVNSIMRHFYRIEVLE